MLNDAPILGRGWAFPPTFGGGGTEVAMVAGEEDIRQSLQIILGTAPGERVMQDGFGCDLPSLQFAEVDQRLLSAVERLVSNALLYHERRIDVEQVAVDQSSDEPECLMISITYTVRTTNSRFNMIYPYYLSEASPLQMGR